jgi:flagellar protein FliO/FliZ
VDTLVIALRVALSLGVVLALMWVLHRRMQKGQFGAGRARGRRTAAVEVVARQGIGGKASVVVVDVDGERLVLGVGEHGVSLLTSGAVPAPELTIVAAPVELPSGAERAEGTAPVTAETAPAEVAPSAPTTSSADRFRAELAEQDRVLTGLPAAPAPVVALPTVRPRYRRSSHAAAAATPAAQQLQGSILAPDTWRQAAAALRSRRVG